MNLLDFRKNIYSQNGEDGVLEKICSLLDIKHGTFCEFGAWNGKYMSNTYNLLESRNWSGVYIEGDPGKYQELSSLNSLYKERIQSVNKYVTLSGDGKLDTILKTTTLPYDFDLLSIDIDGLDYHIWDSLKEYRPKLVIIEVNSNFKPSGEYRNQIADISDRANTDPWEEGKGWEWRAGSSFNAVCELGASKGYQPIIHFGNVILGEKTFLEQKSFPVTLDIDSLYNIPYPGNHP